MSWVISEPAEGINCLAEADSVWLRPSIKIPLNSANLRACKPKNRLGRLLPTLIPQLVEMGIATREADGVCIPYQDFVTLEDKGFDAFDSLVPWSPFTIEVESTGWPGSESFGYFYHYYFGLEDIYLERLGCFVRRSERVYRLDSQTFALIEAIDAFNALPIGKKQGRDAFLRFAEVKELADGVGAKLDAFLPKERVLVPSRVGVDLILDEDGRITFVPKFDGAPVEAMRRAFLSGDDIEEVYSLDHPDGGRIRVVLDDTQREVLRRMQGVRRLGGRERAEVLRDPQSVFDGVAQAVDIDLGPRVKGIGDFPFVAQPYLQRTSTGVFEDCEKLAETRQSVAKFSAGLKCRYADGSEKDLPLVSREQVLQLKQMSEEALLSGRGTIDFAGKSLVIDQSFVQSVKALSDRIISRTKTFSDPPSRSGQYILIYTNEKELEYEEKYEGGGGDTDLILPRSLLLPLTLKDHQRAGVAWLQRNFGLQRHGCLLADDMGLGKTLQILVFLAWLIEKGELARGSVDPEAAPWDPILIVTPVILLENETWINDMQTFFATDGAIFRPWLVLHGSKLREMRSAQRTGRETAIGEPLLDLDKLRQYRVVLTNYETVVNYQHSFARMKDRWTIVVTDEAQEYKTPNTKISDALKGLAPRFRIACTGTPVETRLLDVWNVFDFLQPGQLLGSATNFRDKYEVPIEEHDEAGVSEVLSGLKGRLFFGRPDAFVLRREKSELKGLPAKNEHQLFCDLTAEQIDWHLELVGRARTGGEGNHPFKLISQLMRLYQHPGLVPQYEPMSTSEALNSCPKLAKVVECLDDIRRKKEKALIFTRSLDMQQLLSGTIGETFNLEIDIINGTTSRQGSTQQANKTRKAIVKQFRDSQGFNVLVLSPEVAGIGLTLTEANHVIHYGRWWNPAKEAQATDRVYRIGQTRDVHVYFPIARHPQRTFPTFDEKLDGLIRRRSALAAEFLAPMPTEDELQEELLKEVLGTAPEPESKSHSRGLTQEDVRSLKWDRFESLIAALEEHKGAQTILTPRGGDGGIDVISIQGKQIRLIQCKHTSWETSIDADVVAEMLQAFDGYRIRVLPRSTQETAIVPVLVTNGHFTQRAQAEARTRDVKLIGERDLWDILKNCPCTRGDVEAAEQKRLATMRDVRIAVEKMTGLK